jgi:hypothetical protein
MDICSLNVGFARRRVEEQPPSMCAIADKAKGTDRRYDTFLRQFEDQLASLADFNLEPAG